MWGVLWAQEPGIIALTNQIGYTLDAVENKYYGVFTDIPGFESAQFIEINPNRYEVRIVFVEYTRKKISKRAFNLRELNDLQIRLKQMRPITEEDREAMREDFTYLKVEETLNNIPKGQYVNIKHWSGKRINGTLLYYGKQKLIIQTPVSMETVPVWEMERISYRKNIVDRPNWKLKIYGIAALAGLMLMETWNVQTNPRAEMVWHNRFMGAAIGTLAGAEVYDTIMILISPKTYFALTPAEMEKLKN